jgi:chromosome segregation ATPase
LKTEQKRLGEEIMRKRRELEDLDNKISEKKLQYEPLERRYGALKVLVDELERLRNKYVYDIANYKMEYGEYMGMLERVSTKLKG